MAAALQKRVPVGPKMLLYALLPAFAKVLKPIQEVLKKQTNKKLKNQNQGFLCTKALLITEQSCLERDPRTRRVIALGLALGAEQEDPCVT